MSTIEERVVSMKFNNAQFQQGIQSTLGSLDKLKTSLSSGGATKALDGIASSAKNISLDGVSSAVDKLSEKFGALSVVGITALSTIANKAVNAGMTMVKSLTIGPIGKGFGEYEAGLTAFQTIVANTKTAGATIKDVNNTLADLNVYANKTIYSFGDMTTAIGLFTAQGVKLGDSVTGIKGIYNLVSLTGGDANKANSAIYQLSQAIASGSVKAQDWISVVTAGIGGTDFQNQLKQTARVHGIQVDKMIKKEGSFKDSLTDGWLTSKVLLETLSQYTGDMSASQLKSMGYTQQQIKQIQELGATANNSATNVKSFTQLMDTLTSNVVTSWASSFKLVIGNLDQASVLWTAVGNQIGGMMQKSYDARNKLLLTWNKGGGRSTLLQGIALSFQALMSVIKPIQEAFREIFPATTGKQLVDITVVFRDFVAKLILTKDEAANLKTTFKGIFSIFSIVFALVKGMISTFFNMFSIVQGGTGGFLALTAVVGAFISKINDLVVKTGAIKAFFDGMNKAKQNVLGPLVKFISMLAIAFASLFQGDTSGFVTKMGVAFSGLIAVFNGVRANILNMLGNISKVTGAVGKFLSSLGLKALAPVITAFNSVSAMVKKLQGQLSFKIDFTGMFKGLSSGVATGASGTLSIFSDVGKKLQSVWDGVTNAFSKVGNVLGKILHPINQVFSAIGDKLTEYIKGLNMQDAVALLNTGFFIAMYAALRKFLSNMGGLIKSVSGTFNALTSSLKTMQQSVKAKIILEIAASVGVLVAALYVLSTLDPKRLGAGLAGIAALMIMITATMKSMLTMTKQGEGDSWKTTGKAGANLMLAGGALILMSTAILILASAVKKLGSLSPVQLAQGLASVGTILASLSLFTKMAEANKGGMAQSGGLILLAIAIRILSSSVITLGQTDTGVLIKGILALGVVLTLLTGMVKLVNGTIGMVQAAAGILILSFALMSLSIAIRIYAAMDYGVMTKGLLLMIATLGTIGLAMRTFPPNMPATAAGLLIVSGALLVISGVLKILGAMSVAEIAKSIITLGLALGIIAIAVNAMTGAMAGAAALVVVAFALTGFAVVLKILGSLSWESIAKGLVAISAVFLILGVAGLLIGPVVPILFALGITMMLLGTAMLVAGAGFALFAVGFAMFATIGTAGFAVLMAGFTSLLGLIPLFAQQIGLGMLAFAKVIGGAGPTLVTALTTILLSLLTALNNIIPPLVYTMGVLVISLVTKLVQLIPFLAAAGLQMIIGLMTALNSRVGDITAVGISIITNFLNALATGVPKLVAAAVNLLVAFVNSIGSPANIKKILDSAVGFVLNFVNGLSKAIDDHAAEIGTAAGKLAVAVGAGLVHGLGAAIREVAKHAGLIGGAILNKLADVLGAKSPSKEAYKFGMYTGQGLANGLKAYSGLASTAAEGVGSNAIDAMRKSISGVSDLITEPMDMQPTITPVLDLTKVQKDAGLISTLLPSQKISVGSAYSAASSLATPTTSTQMLNNNIKALASLVNTKPADDKKTAPRPVEFHIGTIQDGDSLLRRARANDRMLSLAEGGDSPQMVGVGI